MKIKINGEWFRKSWTCSNYSRVRAHAVNKRLAGYLARIIERGNSFVVYTRKPRVRSPRRCDL